MRAQLVGRLGAPAVAAIGVWDPVAAEQRDLFKRLQASARADGHSALAIAIDPHPAAYRPGEPAYAVYSDLPSRVHALLNLGLEAVLALRFTSRDVYAGVEEVLDAVMPHAPLAELWLGATQSLGRGAAGDSAAIDAATNARGITVRRLGEHESAAHEVRALLRAGRVAEVGRIVGAPPTRRRPEVGDLRFGWRPGVYEALAVGGGADAGRCRRLTIELRGRDRGAQRMAWPDPAIEAVAFVAGPTERPSPNCRS